MNVLAVSAHADDETLGCGGTLLRHRDRGDAIHWLVVTDAWEGGRWSTETIAERDGQIDRVAETYGARELTRLGYPAGRLDTVAVADVMDGIGGVVARARPEVVYLVHPGDVHTDHGAAFRATMSVLKPFHLRRLGVRRVLAYETLSSADAAAIPSFVPNVHADISAWLERKLEVMAMYATEFQPEPLPRSASAIRALARYRGATIGVEYAEALVLIRALV